ncbi:MAG TPA: biotin transporter BioY [bacterium]|nr:biotin transporter BioY [bacterium]
MNARELAATRVLTSETQKAVFFIGAFAALTFLGSLVRVYLPFTPVPVTLQTLFVFLSVYYLRPGHAGLSQSLYIFAGLIGAPVFAAGITGALILVGPTAGYLAGFIVAAVVMAFLYGKAGKMSVLKAAVIFTAGTVIIYSLGILNLVLVYKLSPVQAFTAGALPFIPGDVLKIAAAAAFCKIAVK